MTNARQLTTAINARRMSKDAEFAALIKSSRRAGTRARTLELIEARSFFWCAFSDRMYAISCGA